MRHGRLTVRSTRGVDTIEITDRVADVVRRSGVREGICVVAVLHTTVGVFINENADPDVRRDLVATLAKLVPDDAPYAHAEGNSPGHIKSALVGTSVTVPVREGALDLGTWQGVYLAEFDGPRDRTAVVTVLGGAAD